MTIQSRSHIVKSERISRRSLSTKRFDGTGNIGRYVQDILPTLPRPVQDHNPVNGQFLSNRTPSTPETVKYVTARANRFYDRTGRVPDAQTIAGWL